MSDILFECRKCQHRLTLVNGTDRQGDDLSDKLDRDCPECGEDGEIWIYIRRVNV